MKKQVATDLKEVIQLLDRKYSNDKQVAKFEASAAEFEELVKKGLIKKRGNNSFSILNSGAYNVTFNS